MVAPDRERLRRAFQRGRTAAGGGDGGGAEAESAAPDRAPAADLLDLLRRREAARLRQRPVVELPPGRELDLGHGPFWCRRHELPGDTAHGCETLGAARGVDRARLAALTKVPAAVVDPARCLFVDTETTGLHGGAGTVVFGWGLGWFEADTFVFEQAFLRDFGEEPAILHWFAERLHARPVPVTFVGKSFDRHRIAARLAVHRVAAPVLTDAHLDLYHAARRAWGRELPDTRLRTVEEHRLGLVRAHDLPGSEAPAAFLDWLRDRSGPVDRVLEHNRLDVLSLVALFARLGREPGAGNGR